MKTQPTNISNWVHCQLEHRAPYWVNVSGLKYDLPDDEYHKMLKAFEFGKAVVLEDANMELKALPMPIRDQKRMLYLTQRFEREGFQVFFFRDDSVVFYRPGQLANYYSMNEMLDHGFMPKPGIAISPINVPVFEGSKLIDVFVPVGQGADHFTKYLTHHA